MAKFSTERVLEVHHWNETLFSFKTTRDPGLRFRNGEFIMLGLTVAERPLMRAYSIASANHEDHLEFLSIKVKTGKLTSALQHLKTGDDLLIGSKPTGSLLLDDLKSGKNLYLFGTGTGLAPFLAIVQDPETKKKAPAKAEAFVMSKMGGVLVATAPESICQSLESDRVCRFR